MWRTRGRGLVLLLAGCLAQALLVGCGGGSQTLTAQQQLCLSVSDLKASAVALSRLDLDSTRAEVQQSVDGLLIALGNVSDDVGRALESNVDTIERSLDQLSSNIGSLPDNASIGDLVAAVQQSVPALRAALNEVLSGVDCSDT
jgi:hypothetical protein